MNPVICRVGRNRLSAEVASEFVRASNQYPIDERLGECEPFHQVLVRSLERTMRRFGAEQQDSGTTTWSGTRPDRPFVRVWVTEAILDC
ncbi:hypothetical protein ABZ027_04050 [Streptomyces sp. NPDC006332]|uniref:hypothetical protein n=1 Tax=Streptomyces sp. NPDC006332 TaxID=3155456 RepID=UPI0033B74E55